MHKHSASQQLPMLEDLGPVPAAVKSAARALRVIEFFDEIRRAARANEIASRLGYPQSSTSNLLNSLVRLGYLDFDPKSKTYLPSIRIAVLATWRDTGCFRDGSMSAMLGRLSKATGLAACLSSRTGIFTRYLHIVQPFGPGDVHITLVARRYSVQSATGIVLLARLDNREIRDILHRTLAEKQVKIAGLTLATVLDRVNEAREKGYFVSAGLVTPSTGAIAKALPVSVTGGWQDMAISLAGQRELVESRPEELGGLLDAALRELTRPFESADQHT